MPGQPNSVLSALAGFPWLVGPREDQYVIYLHCVLRTKDNDRYEFIFQEWQQGCIGLF